MKKYTGTVRLLKHRWSDRWSSFKTFIHYQDHDDHRETSFDKHHNNLEIKYCSELLVKLRPSEHSKHLAQIDTKCPDFQPRFSEDLSARFVIISPTNAYLNISQALLSRRKAIQMIQMSY